MKFPDLLQLSLRNLWRRKLRTFLTVLGVLIGTTSIVVMVSFVVAQTAYFYEMINSNNELTTIKVRKSYNYKEKESNSTEEKIIDAELLTELAKLPGVKKAYPVLEKQILFKSGNYQSNNSVVALPNEALAEYNYDMVDADGHKLDFDYADFSKGRLQFVIGDDFAKNFYNSNGRDSDDYEKDKIDPFAKALVYYLEVDMGNKDAAPGYTPKRFHADVVARIKPKERDYESRWRVYTNLETLENILKKEFRGRGFEDQPRTKSGRWTGKIAYSYILLRTESLDDSKSLVKLIEDMGYTAESQAAWIDQINDQMKQMGMVFGGIGAISLLVAAIGIANTMMMSIYERTKEIGVFKVLGCKLPNIRNMFLIEASSIGFIGGVIGLILSTLLSFILNSASTQGGIGIGVGGGSKISMIPFWLYALGLIFSTLIGMLSGLLPALRAMKLSPLEALRTE